MKLDLSAHCIQTEIKRRYNRSVSRFFKLEKDDPALAADIELLKTALENLDFPHLRSAHAVLAGGQADHVVELVAGDAGEVAVRLDGRIVY